MYAIGHVILGTMLPWTDEGGEVSLLGNLDHEYMVHDYDEGHPRAGGIEPDDGCDDSEYFIECVLEDEGSGWTRLYHGSSPTPSAYAGVELHEFDESNHFALSTLTSLVPTEEQTAVARAAYDKLPPKVRELLPPFGLYVVWSSS